MNMDLARKGIDDEDFGDGQREIAEFLFNRVRELEATLRKIALGHDSFSNRIPYEQLLYSAKQALADDADSPNA